MMITSDCTTFSLPNWGNGDAFETLICFINKFMYVACIF